MQEWQVELLHKGHDRHTFDCGNIPLNQYLKKYARQNAQKNLSRTFVAITLNAPERILGFYTLSAGNIAVEHLPPKIQKKLPQYPEPIARLGRLAVDQSFQGQGLGAYLLMDSFKRCVALAQEMGIWGVVVDAKDRSAQTFYQQYGFHALTSTPMTLCIPLSTVIKSVLKS